MVVDGSQGLKVSVEESEEADLREIVQMLKVDFHKLTTAIDFNTENARRLAILVNARQKIAMTIFTGTSLLRDPKLQLSTQSGKRRDLARLIQRALLKNNPALNKMVGEAANKENLEQPANGDDPR